MKTMFSKQALFLLAVVGGFLLFPRHAYAYLDPGTGSLLLQALLAAVFAMLFVIKSYFQKIKSLIFGSDSKETEQEKQDSKDE